MSFCPLGGTPRLEGLGIIVSSAPELSIVIPSFNEELRLPATLEKIAVAPITVWNANQ